MKYVIVGRTATGKSHLLHMLENAGLTVLRSYTTRPQRSEKDDGYTFVSKEEAAAIPDDKKCLCMSLNGNDYFVIKDDIMEADAMILDPTGLKQLADLIPDTSLHIIHVTPAESIDLLELAKQRADDPAAAELEYTSRTKAEDDLFTKFETCLADPDYPAENCRVVHDYVNDFTDESGLTAVEELVQYKNVHDNMSAVIRHDIMLGKVVSDRQGKIPMTYRSRDRFGPDGNPLEYPKHISIDLFADIAINDPKLFQQLLMHWMSEPVRLDRLDKAVKEIIEQAEIAELNKDLSEYGDFADIPDEVRKQQDEAALLSMGTGDNDDFTEPFDPAVHDEGED